MQCTRRSSLQPRGVATATVSLAQSPPANLAANSALARGPPLSYTIPPPASVVGYDSRTIPHGPSGPSGPRAFMGHCLAVSPLTSRSAQSMTAGLFGVPPSVASVGAVPDAVFVFSASSLGAVPPSPGHGPRCNPCRVTPRRGLRGSCSVPGSGPACVPQRSTAALLRGS